MNKKILFTLFIFLVFFGLSFGIINLVQAAGPSFTLTRTVMGAGGLGGSADIYTIASTLGQPVAGLDVAGDHPMTSGFWTRVGEALAEFFNFLPVIKR